MSQRMKAIQPEKLVANLKTAARPHQRPVPKPQINKVVQAVTTIFLAIPYVGQFARMLYELLLAPKPQTGIPHGVENLRVRAHNVGVRGGEIVFCHSRDYQALGHVPDADGYPYPCNPQTVEVQALPPDGYYNAVMRVSVNGSVAVTIEEFENV